MGGKRCQKKKVLGQTGCLKHLWSPKWPSETYPVVSPVNGCRLNALLCQEYVAVHAPTDHLEPVFDEDLEAIGHRPWSTYQWVFIQVPEIDSSWATLSEEDKIAVRPYQGPQLYPREVAEWLMERRAITREHVKAGLSCARPRASPMSALRDVLNQLDSLITAAVDTTETPTPSRVCKRVKLALIGLWNMQESATWTQHETTHVTDVPGEVTVPHATPGQATLSYMHRQETLRHRTMLPLSLRVLFLEQLYYLRLVEICSRPGVQLLGGRGDCVYYRTNSADTSQAIKEEALALRFEDGATQLCKHTENALNLEMICPKAQP